MIRLIRQGLLLVALALALPAEAATRYWSLQGVVFEDGTTLAGSFGYDDVANEVTSWNIRVQGGSGYQPFTLTPGNSNPVNGGVGITGGFVYFFQFVAMEGTDAERWLWLSVKFRLDGSVASQPLYLVDPANPAGFYYAFERKPGVADDRRIVAGSVVLVPFPPAVGLVDVVEFYHSGLGHYFMTADPPEIAGLDSGYFPGWTRTGESFKAYAAGSSAGATMNPVCRYFKWPVAGVTTHFYSANAYECWLVDHLFGPEWVIENDNVFQVDLPDQATGACPGSTIPVYRLWNGVLPTNHRYTTSLAVRSTMMAAGWIPEGYGPVGVAMCTLP